MKEAAAPDRLRLPSISLGMGPGPLPRRLSFQFVISAPESQRRNQCGCIRLLKFNMISLKSNSTWPSSTHSLRKWAFCSPAVKPNPTLTQLWPFLVRYSHPVPQLLQQGHGILDACFSTTFSQSMDISAAQAPMSCRYPVGTCCLLFHQDGTI